MANWFRGSWLAETCRAGLALVVSLVVAFAVAFPPPPGGFDLAESLDNAVLVMFAYLATYVVLTAVVFARSDLTQVRRWAAREGRGSWSQRYLLGTAPGPGASISVSLLALAVAVLWLPRGDAGSNLPLSARIVVGTATVVLCWVTIVLSFSVAYHADDLLEDHQALDFPGVRQPGWRDYVYFAVAISTTFGTTDVTVRSSAMRLTVTVHGVLAFVFNTVILAAVVGVLVA